MLRLPDPIYVTNLPDIPEFSPRVIAVGQNPVTGGYSLRFAVEFFLAQHPFGALGDPLVPHRFYAQTVVEQTRKGIPVESFKLVVEWLNDDGEWEEMRWRHAPVGFKSIEILGLAGASAGRPCAAPGGGAWPTLGWVEHGKTALIWWFDESLADWRDVTFSADSMVLMNSSLVGLPSEVVAFYAKGGRLFTRSSNDNFAAEAEVSLPAGFEIGQIEACYPFVGQYQLLLSGADGVPQFRALVIPTDNSPAYLAPPSANPLAEFPAVQAEYSLSGWDIRAFFRSVAGTDVEWRHGIGVSHREAVIMPGMDYFDPITPGGHERASAVEVSWFKPWSVVAVESGLRYFGGMELL